MAIPNDQIGWSREFKLLRYILKKINSLGILVSRTFNNIPTLLSQLTNDTGYITGADVPSNETDPIVGAINGIVKADGAGNISVAVAGTDYQSPIGCYKTVTISPTGADYTTIQAALNDNTAGNELFLVFPATYANDTINFTANNQCIIGMGTTNQQVVTNTAQIVNGGAFLNCRIENIKMLGTYTSAIDLISFTGSLAAKFCHLEVNASGTIAGSPRVVYTTGDYIQAEGSIVYNNAANSGGQVKRAIEVGTGGTAELRRVIIDIDGSNASTAITTGYSTDSGTINIYRCFINVNDTTATLVVGLADLLGSGTNEYMSNDIHVTCGGVGKTAYGLYVTSGTAIQTRLMYNLMHVVDSGGGTSYSFYLGANVTIISQFDDKIAADNYYDGGGVLYEVSSPEDGNLRISHGLNWGDIITTDDTYNGQTLNAIVDTNSIGFGALLAQADDFHFDEADATSIDTVRMLVMALETGTGTKKVLLKGQICNTSWNWSSGAIYASEDSGELTQTSPCNEDAAIIIVGWALSTDTIYFDPYSSWTTTEDCCSTTTTTTVAP